MIWHSYLAPDFLSIAKFKFGPVKILKFFVFERKTFKFWYDIYIWALISYQLQNLNSGPPFGQPGPPKGQYFKIFVFEHRPFKIWYDTHFWALIPNPLKYCGSRRILARPGPRNVKIEKNLFLNVNLTNLIWHWIWGPDLISFEILWFGARNWSPGPYWFHIFWVRVRLCFYLLGYDKSNE